ncbi:hypothetical protein M422DRAFT_50462 [Sphaerobolus stellatus SS14]|uniref:Uncharacterized protein n=1 Tax=Sphaerobolus stellatus (strain SS14) TaxID=990650 RepID=A0A0C9URH6_SPHS4|nr:hypothetical protein M422DRAFT_50462 [Sphaerobolus stellatus SS14]
MFRYKGGPKRDLLKFLVNCIFRFPMAHQQAKARYDIPSQRQERCHSVVAVHNEHLIQSGIAFEEEFPHPQAVGSALAIAVHNADKDRRRVIEDATEPERKYYVRTTEDLVSLI